jgi:hypothetical protein
VQWLSFWKIPGHEWICILLCVCEWALDNVSQWGNSLLFDTYTITNTKPNTITNNKSYGNSHGSSHNCMCAWKIQAINQMY